MRKYGGLLLVGFLLAMILAGVGCAKKAVSTAGAGKADAVIVDGAQVKKGSLSLINTVSGKLDALNSADIVAKSPGKVASISVDVGSPVSAGQTLISLEADDLAAALNYAQAGVENARIAYDLAQKQYEREKQLLEAGALSQADFDNLYQGVLDKAQVALKSAQATAAQSQAKYNDSFIKSPLDGLVTARNIDVGEEAGSSSPIITVMNLDKVVVVVSVLEDQVNRVKEGQEVKVKVSAVSETPFTGTVSNIALAANATTKVFPIKIQVNNSDHILKPGMFADVSFTWVGDNGLLVPSTAVTTYNGSQRVFLIKDGAVKETKVTTGTSDAQNTLITSGLSEGDQVVVNGSDASLKDGAKVKLR
ncbi:MAG TPA: efflux RND transporter periplasmic adaptor subunit [Syntrophomonadaceae bacterium]|nr:efflux RND transporter periplasmic adaptor subunit [Syntrophomonadaceae bacterium]